MRCPGCHGTNRYPGQQRGDRAFGRRLALSCTLLRLRPAALVERASWRFRTTIRSGDHSDCAFFKPAYAQKRRAPSGGGRTIVALRAKMMTIE